jgi:GH15 family glucan-1,4-alpha-glucosidase
VLMEARIRLEKLLSLGNHVGLFAEEISTTGQALGNFPQAFTHLALISACLALNEAIDTAQERRH